jgi:hypothetical protein
MQAKYLRNDWNSVVTHAIEEAGEFVAAAGKTLRWGPESYNPEIPPENRESNRDWMRREMHDLRLALIRLELALDGNLDVKTRS